MYLPQIYSESFLTDFAVFDSYSSFARTRTLHFSKQLNGLSILRLSIGAMVDVFWEQDYSFTTQSKSESCLPVITGMKQ